MSVGTPSNWMFIAGLATDRGDPAGAWAKTGALTESRFLEKAGLQDNRVASLAALDRFFVVRQANVLENGPALQRLG